MRRWKLIGLAGVAGVAAGTVLLARRHREQPHYEPDEVRARLRERLAEAGPTIEPVAPVDVPVRRRRARWRRR